MKITTESAPGMEPAVRALLTKRQLIAASIERLQSELKCTCSQLDSVEAAIRVFEPDIDRSRFGSRPVPPPHAAFRGEISRILLSALREAPSPVSTRKLTEAVMSERGLAKTTVVKSEKEACPFIEETVSQKAELHADQGSGWNQLSFSYPRFERINHKESYWTPTSHTNNAENFFSILRRTEEVYHHISSTKFLPAYVQEVTWRQNNRRVPSSDRFGAILEASARQGFSKLKGSWQKRVQNEQAYN